MTALPSVTRLSRGRLAVALVAIALAYVAGGRAGLDLAQIHRSITAVWPPAGIALAAIVILGMRALPAVYAGALAVNVWNGSSMETAAAIAAGNTLGPLAAAVICGRLGHRVDLARPRDCVVLGMAGLQGALESATLGVGALAVTADLTSSAWPTAWLTWWVGDSAGAILVAPMILAAVRARQSSWRSPAAARLGEFVALMILTVAITVTAFGTAATVRFAAFPALIWAAMRFRQVGAVAVVAVVAVIDIRLTSTGHGEFGALPPTQSLLALQAFNGLFAMTGYLLAAATTQTRDAQRLLADGAARLEQIVKERTDALAVSETRYREAMDYAHEVVFEADAGRFTFLSPAWERLTGYTAEEALGGRVTDFLHPADRDEYRRRIAGALADTTTDELRYEHRYITKAGEIRWVSLIAQVRRAPDGSIVGGRGTMTDVTARKKAEQNLLAMVGEMSTIALITHQLAAGGDIRRTACQAAVAAVGADRATLLEPDGEGYLRATAINDTDLPEIRLRIDADQALAVDAFLGGEPLFAANAREDPRTSKEMAELINAGAVYTLPLVVQDQTVGVLSVTWREPLPEMQERARHLLKTVSDEVAVAIHRDQLRQRLDEAARTDPLTGLRNRRSWDEDLARAMASARRRKEPLCVALVDLDYFKAYNDSRGHQAGDALIRGVATAWQRGLRESDIVARFGGDEFLLGLVDCDAGSAAELVERVRTTMPEGQRCSVGVAQWDGAESAAEVLRRADEALYVAKRGTRDQVVVAGRVPAASGRGKRAAR